MTALVNRIPGALTLIAAFRGDEGSRAADSPPSEATNRTAFTANAALLAIVWTLLWLWFTAHVKPHVSTFIFGGVSLASLSVVAAAVFFSFVKKEDAVSRLRGWLHSRTSTRTLLASLPLIAFAYATTFTLYLTAGDTAEVRLIVRNGGSSTPVTLSSAQKQKAVSYFFAFRPVTVRIETVSPSGYNAGDLRLRRGIPAELAVPDRSWKKSLFVVRLIPLYNLVDLRGRTDPDMHYVLRVFVPGARQPIERSGLTFGAIYLGASLADLQAQSKEARSVIADLRNTLHGLDSEMGPRDIDDIIGDWLDAPKFIPTTTELKPGDQVRVVLEWPDGKSEQTVKVAAAPVTTAFLSGKGAEE
ncbi:MAG TPA: hypothetical protein VII75_03125 [Thermoanaerobaculia bacterium]